MKTSLDLPSTYTAIVTGQLLFPPQHQDQSVHLSGGDAGVEPFESALKLFCANCDFCHSILTQHVVYGHLRDKMCVL